MDKIWFEVKVTRELAAVLQRIVMAYHFRGNAARAAFLERLKNAIPNEESTRGTRVQIHTPGSDSQT